MARRIGPKRLQHLINEGVDPRTLSLQQQFEFARTMAHLMTQPPEGTPRRLPRSQRPRCGAMCRTGWPCRRRMVWDESNDRPRNKRCPNHGGMSTGPKSLAGRQRIAASNRARAQARRLDQERAAARARALAQVQAQEQAAVLTSTQVQEQALAREQAQALSAYQRSLAYAELTRWAESWKEVERAYQWCRAVGVDPRS